MYGITSLCFCLLFGQIYSSAIPMWEYLNKNEKMSYLYSTFANQVEEYCEFSEMEKCNQELLTHGLKTLREMPEEQLDAMDPYQRGANSIIWDTITAGHVTAKPTQYQRSTTTPPPNSYDGDLSFSKDDDFGFDTAASAKIGNIYRIAPPKDFVFVRPDADTPYTLNSGTPQYMKPPTQDSQNALPFEDIYPSKNVQPNGNRFNLLEATQQLSIGSPSGMVVWVYPDGTPVSEEPVNIPQDEDLRQYQMSQARLPNL